MVIHRSVRHISRMPTATKLCKVQACDRDNVAPPPAKAVQNAVTVHAAIQTA